MNRKHTAIYQMSDRRNDDFVPGTPAERIGLVWPLTREITSLSNQHDAERRLQRHITALSGEKVKFLLVGADALAAHGYPRATLEIDIWVMPSPQNADAVLRALHCFGAPLHNLTRDDLQKDGAWIFAPDD